MAKELRYSCDHGCGFEGVYATVAEHELTCLRNPDAKPAAPLMVCDHGCGFEGDFDAVAQHELTCRLGRKKKAALRKGQTRGQAASLVQEPWRAKTRRRPKRGEVSKPGAKPPPGGRRPVYPPAASTRAKDAGTQDPKLARLKTPSFETTMRGRLVADARPLTVSPWKGTGPAERKRQPETAPRPRRVRRSESGATGEGGERLRWAHLPDGPPMCQLHWVRCELKRRGVTDAQVGCHATPPPRVVPPGPRPAAAGRLVALCRRLCAVGFVLGFVPSLPFSPPLSHSPLQAVCAVRARAVTALAPVTPLARPRARARHAARARPRAHARHARIRSCSLRWTATTRRR